MDSIKSHILLIPTIIIFIISSGCSNSQKAYVSINLGNPIHSVVVAPVSPLKKIASRINDFIAPPLNAAPGDITEAYIAVFEGEAVKENLLSTELFSFDTPPKPASSSTIVLEVPAGKNRTFVVYGAGISANTFEYVILQEGIASGITLKAGEESTVTIAENITAPYSISSGMNTVWVTVTPPSFPETYYQIEVKMNSGDPWTEIYDDYNFTTYFSIAIPVYMPNASRIRGYSKVFSLARDWK